MESKRKKRKDLKAVSVIPGPPKSEVQPPKSPQALIHFNGELVEELFRSPVWNEILFPIIQESIAGCTGRFTNGRFYKGEFTRSRECSFGFVSGYQTALEDLHNHLHDFILAKQKLGEDAKKEEEEKRAPLYNPFLEDEED